MLSVGESTHSELRLPRRVLPNEILIGIRKYYSFDVHITALNLFQVHLGGRPLKQTPASTTWKKGYTIFAPRLQRITSLGIGGPWIILKHTKFEKSFLMVLTNQLIYLVNVKTMRKVFSNYVCFSKSPNFIYDLTRFCFNFLHDRRRRFMR